MSGVCASCFIFFLFFKRELTARELHEYQLAIVVKSTQTWFIYFFSVSKFGRSCVFNMGKIRVFLSSPKKFKNCQINFK